MASSNIGNTGASALLRSAASIASAQADYQDKMAALTWSNSAQTDSDWTTYSSYLKERIDHLQGTGSLSNASKALSLTSTVQSAQKSYISNSIQRQSIDILEGNGTLQDKANQIASFYEMAANNGDEGLAQNLRSQYDSVDQQIQYQAQQQQELAKSMADAKVTSVNAYVDTLKQDLTNLNSQIGGVSIDKIDSLGEDVVKQLGDTGVNLGLPKNASIYDIYNGVLNKMVTSLQVAGTALGPVDGASLISESNQITSGNTKFKLAGATVDYTDIQNAVAAAGAGQNYFSFVQRNGQTQAVANKEESLVWAKDPTTGNMSIIPTFQNNGINANYGQTGLVQNRDGTFTKSTQATDKQTDYGTLLKNAGFDVQGTDSGGNLIISGNAQTAKMLKDAGFDPNSFSTNLVAGPDGQLRFEYTDSSGATNLYGLTFDGSGKLSSPFKVDPLSDTQSGYAGSLTSVNGLIANGQLKQTQALQIAQLQNTTQQGLKLPSLPQVQTPTIQPAVAPIQSAPTITAIQNTAPASVLQKANGNPQQASTANVNQSGKSSGITLQQPTIKTIPL